MRNMCETCGGGGEFSRGKSISYLTALLRNLGTARANSCVLQLRGFCFPGSALNIIGFPPIKQPLALEAEAFASGCPR